MNNTNTNTNTITITLNGAMWENGNGWSYSTAIDTDTINADDNTITADTTVTDYFDSCDTNYLESLAQVSDNCDMEYTITATNNSTGDIINTITFWSSDVAEYLSK